MDSRPTGELVDTLVRDVEQLRGVTQAQTPGKPSSRSVGSSRVPLGVLPGSPEGGHQPAHVRWQTDVIG